MQKKYDKFCILILGVASLLANSSTFRSSVDGPLDLLAYELPRSLLAGWLFVAFTLSFPIAFPTSFTNTYAFFGVLVVLYSIICISNSNAMNLIPIVNAIVFQGNTE